MDFCVIFHPKAGFCCLKWCTCIYELDSSHEMNYYLQELRNLPLAKDTNSVLQRWAGVGVSLIAWPDVSNMLQGNLDFHVPGAELQKLENGVGMRERGKVKHMSESVCRDLGKHLFWKKGSCRNSDGILLKRTFWAKQASPCYFCLYLRGQNGEQNRASLFPPNLSSLSPHPQPWLRRRG